MELLSSKTDIQRLTENERLRGLGTLQNGSIKTHDARQFNGSQSVICSLQNRRQQTRNVTDLPRGGRPRSTQRQDHLFVTNALRDGTQTAAQLQQQLFYDTEVLVATQTEKTRRRKVYMSLSCELVVPTLCCYWMPTIARQGGYGVDPVRGGLSHSGLIYFSDVSKFVLAVHDGWQRVWHRSGQC